MSNTEALVESIVAGTATEAEVGLALKAMKTQLSVNLVQSLSESYQSIVSFNTLLNDAISRFQEQYQNSAEVLDMQTLIAYIDSITDKQLRLMDLYRKTIQGKDLFAADTMSDEEKKVLKLFRSFKSQEEKKQFLQLVATQMGKDSE